MSIGRPLTFDAKTIRHIRSLAKKGFRISEIAKKIGRHKSGIWSLMKRLGIPRQPHWRFPTGRKNPSWRGGRFVDADGYVLIRKPNHPHAVYGGYVREHRLVMEKHLGRYLRTEEVVHHIDGNKQNNSLDNLKLYERNADHLRDELSGRFPNWSEDGKRRLREAYRRRQGKREASTHNRSRTDVA